MTPVLDFQRVTVRKARARLLGPVTWRVGEHERWVVLGRNGAGKTTLVQVAACQQHPSEGTVRILGELLGAVDVFELRPRIGLASSAFAHRVRDGESVRDVVLTAAYGVNGRWREEYDDIDIERAEDLLRLFGVVSLADRAFGTLSEGERKRVQIARALMADPELLLLDEPSAGLDLGGREELVAALGEIARDPSAPAQVLVTHHVEEIPVGFTHVMLLKDGEVSAAGPLEETLSSQSVSAAFGLPLTVTHDAGRWTARAARS